MAVFDLKKRARGAVLGWVWLIVKPLVFISVFWFALAIGLRARSAMGNVDYPYFVWLVSGLVPWFFMSDMLNAGSDVLHRYPYLVTKVRFPLSGISTLYALSTLAINLMLMMVLALVYVFEGMPWDPHLLQVPIILLLMVVFWVFVSIGTSQLSGISRDFAHLMKALSQPLFWLSGILFNINSISNAAFGWVKEVMLFNPVTFFAQAMRNAVCDRIWIWERPEFLGAFALVFVLTVALACLAYDRFHEEVADVL